MLMNNFQRLYEEEELRFTEADNREVLNSIQGTLRLFRMIGDVADIYLNNMVGVLVDAIDPHHSAEDMDSGRGPTRPAPPDGPLTNPRSTGPEKPPE